MGLGSVTRWGSSRGRGWDRIEIGPTRVSVSRLALVPAPNLPEPPGRAPEVRPGRGLPRKPRFLLRLPPRGFEDQETEDHGPGPRSRDDQGLSPVPVCSEGGVRMVPGSRAVLWGEVLGSEWERLCRVPLSKRDGTPGLLPGPPWQR